MNWKLIGSLSLFGLAMGLATVYVIPSDIEPIVWLAIFVYCAYVLAKNRPRRLFLHGLLLGVANSVWVTAAHVLLFERYIADHAREAGMMKSMPMPDAPRLMMGMTGPFIGVVTGAVIGLLALIASRLIKSQR